MTSHDDLDRPIWGAENIAKEIGRSTRNVYYMVDRGLLPVSKVGRVLVTTRRRLQGVWMGDDPNEISAADQSAA